MDKSAKQMLEEKYPGKFRFDTDEGLYDYVYETQSLSTLAGKKLHSKRNYINRFKQLDWSFEEITPDNIKECEIVRPRLTTIKQDINARAKAENCLREYSSTSHR